MLRFLSTAVVVVTACDRSSSSPPSPSPAAAIAPAQRSPTAIRPLSIDPPAGRGASPNLVATSGGVLMTWLEPIDDAATAHRLRLAKLVGNAWSKPTTITEGPSIVSNWADVPSVAAQADGTLVAH